MGREGVEARFFSSHAGLETLLVVEFSSMTHLSQSGHFNPKP